MAGAKRRRAESEEAATADDAPQGGENTSFSPQPKPTPTPTISLPTPPAKRRRVVGTSSTPVQLPQSTQTRRQSPHIPASSGADLLSPLSDELLLRILSFLPVHHLLAVAPVSRRFYRLSADSQLWKALYYARFVLPRAMRIPGFRDGNTLGSSGGKHKLHYSGRRTLWADGRRGGLVSSRGEVEETSGRMEQGEGLMVRRWGEEEEGEEPQTVNWKRQYKIRHNWARGKCAVEELKLGGEEADGGTGRMLVKVVEGVAVTADRVKGLRAWDLKSRSLIAQIAIGDQESSAAPSCIAVDETESERGALDVALGFDDGSFGVWRLFTNTKRLEQRYRHEKSSNGELIAMALSYPYLLTATQVVLISLYTFEVPSAKETGQKAPGEGHGDVATPRPSKSGEETGKLSSPYLLTSLDSHTSRPPLALSIRRAGKTAIASVAYTISTRRGWSIGIQDLHIHQSASDSTTAIPEIATTRIAYTTPVESGGIARSTPTSPATPQRRNRPANSWSAAASDAGSSTEPEPGPTTLCYTHPYLLATLPDNTLVLHMCTSNASSLSISDGIRLWGHTSGISDAEITARGKAVSVSTRGEEMRVWELEGRASGVGSRSVEIRPWQSPGSGSGGGAASSPARDDWDERRNWVGFDDEMVIVLKERKGARESLMVYDFT
ncbi:hypothetical protein C8A03DRAFT_15123 [Achaetomium macrosporum]|uniref:F-box domain-containing protein n=1 Tax=Achaetomium macrosporum TaxID=79813 RepID=A0AAN7HCH1_9PEZI|nr:hypothetical protein C8A03DRAFT_15123 [Achaetomium macrosporum]